MTTLLDFYKNSSQHTRTNYQQIVFEWTDEQWEKDHSFIQWLFPTKEPSNFNPYAPTLTDEDITAFATDIVLREKIKLAFYRFIAFLGLTWKWDQVEHSFKLSIVKNENFEAKKDLWLIPNHNWLRITRCLCSLKLLYPDLSQDFFACLKQLKEEGFASDTSFSYWQKAMEKELC